MLPPALLVVAAMHASGHQEPAAPTDEAADLAKKLQNPVAALVSVPIKLDWDTRIGPAHADRFLYVIQPVMPFSLNPE